VREELAQALKGEAEIDRLRAEIDHLRAEIARKDKFIHENGYADLQNCVTYKEAYGLDMARKDEEIRRLQAGIARLKALRKEE